MNLVVNDNFCHVGVCSRVWLVICEPSESFKVLFWCCIDTILCEIIKNNEI